MWGGVEASNCPDCAAPGFGEKLTLLGRRKGCKEREKAGKEEEIRRKAASLLPNPRKEHGDNGRVGVLGVLTGLKFLQPTSQRGELSELRDMEAWRKKKRFYLAAAQRTFFCSKLIHQPKGNR